MILVAPLLFLAIGAVCWCWVRGLTTATHEQGWDRQDQLFPH